MAPFATSARDPDPLAETWDELTSAQATLADDITAFAAEIAARAQGWAAGVCGGGRDNAALHAAREGLHGMAERCRDVVRMGWQHVKGERIAVRQEKTDTPLLIPVDPELSVALAAAPKGNMTFLLTELGAPFTPAGFGNWFRDRCNEAELPHCSAHGLRKSAATRLANAGCSTDEIRAITGHKSLSEVARYTAAADQARLARQATDRRHRAEREQSLSNLETRLDKSESN